MPTVKPGPGDPSALESFTRLGLAIGAWSLSPLLIYKSRGLADAPVLALFAVAIGGLLTLLAVFAVGIGGVASEIRVSIKRRSWACEAALIGLGAFVAYPLLYFSAIQRGPPAAVNLVNYLWPVVAVIVVAVILTDGRSLEAGLAAGFGFAGASMAIITGTDVGSLPSSTELYPFFLAALGALVYGGISGAIRLRHPIRRPDSVALFTAALLFGGLVSALLVGILSVASPHLIDLNVTGDRLWTLLVYSALLPVAHLSWMTAVRDVRVPSFSAAFLVPVGSTAILTLALASMAKPQILSALVLVLCGILFASASDKGVPVGYAVSLALLSSIQVSQILAEQVTGKVSQEIGTLSELIAAIAAIFAGFVLSNAIQRNSALHSACSRFYAKAAVIGQREPLSAVESQLDALDSTVIFGIPDPGAIQTSVDPRLQDEFASEWADVDVAVNNGVSSYEWLVLVLGGGSLILAMHSYAAASSSAVTILLRALGVALIVGILFAVRDYDRHRPQGLCKLLVSFRARYGFLVKSSSPLAEGRRYWSSGSTVLIRLGLAALVIVAICAIVLNG